jgi:hypothetical protein
MLLIAQNHKIDMKEVLYYPLRPKPWNMGNTDGTLKNTAKACLSIHIEKQAASVNLYVHYTKWSTDSNHWGNVNSPKNSWW